MTIAALVLLIACANIANLLFARGAADRVPTAVRLALGAPRRRLLRQMISESILLAMAGGAAGLYVGYAGTRTTLLLAFRGAHSVPISPEPSLPALGFAFLLSLITGLIFGVAPAWIDSRADPAQALHGAGRSRGRRHSLARRSLVVLQVALSLVLLAAAGLLTASLRNLQDQPLGFETRGRLMVKVDPALAVYTAERRVGSARNFSCGSGGSPACGAQAFLATAPWRARIGIGTFISRAAHRPTIPAKIKTAL